MTETVILRAIGRRPTAFGHFCRSLGAHKPSDRGQWCTLFTMLTRLTDQGYVQVSKRNTRIDRLQLTNAGANRLRPDPNA